MEEGGVPSLVKDDLVIIVINGRRREARSANNMTVMVRVKSYYLNLQVKPTSKWSEAQSS